MLTALRIEIIAFFPLVVFLGLARRRRWLSDRALTVVTATYMGLFVGTAALYIGTEQIGTDAAQVNILIPALALSVLTWIISYIVLGRMFREWPRR